MNVRERLASLSGDLRALGYDAEDVAGCVRVRLPLWCSVTVEGEPDRIIFVPRFGFSSRDRTVWGNSLMFTMTVALSVFFPVAAGVAALWLGIMLGDIARYVLTESAMNAARVLMVSKASA